MIKPRKLWLLLLVIVTLACFNIAPVSAITEEEVKDFFLNTYNPNVGDIIPDLPLIRSVFGDQVIHIIIEKPDGNIELGATTNSDGFITDLKSGKPDGTTLRLISNEETVEKIKNSENPVSDTRDALTKGDITYEGVGIKMVVIVTVVKIAKFFAELFGII